MITLIFEGIATSGKTSVEQELITLCAERNIDVELVNEDQTLMPILDNTDTNVSIELLKKVLNQASQLGKQVVIFDRFHFTHIFRTQSEMNDFSAIENELLSHNASIIFLKIAEQNIPERIQWALEHREQAWKEHAEKKGSLEQILEYYKNQQRDLEKLLSQTSLSVVTYDTTTRDFAQIAEDIYQKYIITDT